MTKKTKFDSNELLKPINMLNLYAQGAFPMAEDGEINWYQPKERTVITLDDYNIPRSLKKFMQNADFEYKLDHNILEVIKSCANRETTWISEELITAYMNLEKLGFLHSVEAYQHDKLVGGLYGISISGVFFGESMFSKISQASKSALAVLLKHLEKKGFILLDVQFQTPHLKMFGTKEISFDEYNNLLEIAYSNKVSFI